MSTGLHVSATTGEDEVAAALREGRDDDLVWMLEHAHLEGGMSAASAFATLRQTPSRLVRNTAAIAILDLRPPEGADVVAEVLARPAVTQEAGTLVYALDELGGSLPLPTFVTLIALGSYEARAEALILLEQDRVVLRSGDDLDAARARLSSLAASADAEAAEAANEALTRLAVRRRPAA